VTLPLDRSEGDVMASRHQEQVPVGSTDWAGGFVSFAAIIMVLTGGLQALAGLIAIFSDEVYATTPDYLFKFDTTTWGWIHLLLGAVIFLAGFGVMIGQTWARVVGITLAVLGAIVSFLFVPYHPVWALLLVVLNVMVIWALTVYHPPRETY
jgi:hypothetical protein